jgi:hypothetical protein
MHAKQGEGRASGYGIPCPNVRDMGHPNLVRSQLPKDLDHAPRRPAHRDKAAMNGAQSLILG